MVFFNNQELGMKVSMRQFKMKTEMEMIEVDKDSINRIKDLSNHIKDLINRIKDPNRLIKDLINRIIKIM